MKRGDASGTHIVIYDGECGFCSAQVRWLKRLDWFGALKFISFGDPHVKEIAPNVSRKEMAEAVYCVSKNGEVSRAARCFRFLGMRIPLLAPLALLMWFPGVIWIAEKIYEMIARNRSSLSRFLGTSG